MILDYLPFAGPIIESRLYLGWVLAFNFILSGICAFGIHRMLQKHLPRENRFGIFSSIVAVYATTLMLVWAGSKPEPEPPEPPFPPCGPTNAIVIPSARDFDGGHWLLWPSGKFEYKGLIR